MPKYWKLIRVLEILLCIRMKLFQAPCDTSDGDALIAGPAWSLGWLNVLMPRGVKPSAANAHHRTGGESRCYPSLLALALALLHLRIPTANVARVEEFYAREYVAAVCAVSKTAPELSLARARSATRDPCWKWVMRTSGCRSQPSRSDELVRRRIMSEVAYRPGKCDLTNSVASSMSRKC